MTVEGNRRGLLGAVLNAENLALLTKRDRFLIMAAGLIVVAALGAVTVLREQPAFAAALAATSMVIVAALVGLVQWRAIAMGGLEADLAVQNAAARAINGHWWQIVHTSDHPGLSYVSIALSDVAERHAIAGVAFDEHGRRRARWSSDAVALRTTTPVEVYYVWRGSHVGEQEATILSGIGRFRFDSVGREAKPMEAEGAFTRGTTSELEFTTSRLVELVRFTDDESERLADDYSVLPELAEQAFKRLKLSTARDF